MLRTAPTPAQLTALASVHHGLRRTRPLLDGCYLTGSDLSAGPSATPPRPCVHAHRFNPAGTFAHDPVTWHTLAAHGAPLPGPPPSTLDIWQDTAALRA
ncbi:hypothetical protein [Dactylosporangium salmoneum]|uniref:Uncharacterized protein n=1 Tax=Dactylosporangium salmoneum TaxID=53361 RepID=A0ABP5UG05_9ACTN